MMKKKTTRGLAIILAIFFFSFNIIIVPVKAEAATLSVVGGSFGSSGLANFSGLLPAFAPIALAFLGSAGMEVKISESAAAEGMTKTEYLIDQISNWKQGSVESISYVVNEVLTGTSVDQNGVIYFVDTAIDALKQFGNYITGREDIYINSDIPVSEYETVSLDGYELYYGNHISGANGGYAVNYYTSTNVAWFNLMNGSTSMTCMISPDPFTAYYTDRYGQTNLTMRQVNNYYCTWTSNRYMSVTNPQILNIPYGNNQPEFFIQNLSNNWDVQSNETPDVYFEGSKEEWSDFVGGIEADPDYSGAIDTNILNQILNELELERDAVITLQDYINALADAIDNEVTYDIPIQDVGTGEIVSTPEIPVVIDPVYTPVAPADVPVPDEVTPVLDPTKLPAFDTAMGQPLGFDLTAIFPFCIPFDLAAIIGKFSADPVAPNFRINFTIPIVNVEIDYEIDFSPWDQVAAILRTIELVAVIFGLALATRKIIRG